MPDTYRIPDTRCRIPDTAKTGIWYPASVFYLDLFAAESFYPSECSAFNIYRIGKAL